MRTFLTFLLLSLFNTVHLWGQAEEHSPKFSFAIQNGVSNHMYFGDRFEDYNSAYVNAIRVQMALQESQKYSSIIGFQYGKTGLSTNWVCGTDWDYCEMHGVPPIQVKTTERKHYLSLFYNSRILLPKSFYVQGGLSIDFPFISSFHNKYDSSDGKSTPRNLFYKNSKETKFPNHLNFFREKIYHRTKIKIKFKKFHLIYSL